MTSHADGRPVLLYIDGLKAGGAERIALLWARWLQQAGHRVVLLTRHGSHKDFFPLPTSLERRVEPSEPPWLRRLGLLGFPLRLCRLRRVLQDLQPAIVLGITTLPAIKLLLASSGCGWPVVISERNYPPAKPPSLPWRLLRRLTYPWAQIHLVQTLRTADWLVKYQGVAQDRCHPVPNPVIWPLNGFEPRLEPAAYLPVGAAVLLAVGTKPHQKGFDRLIDAFALVAQRFPAWHLVILGLDLAPGRHHRSVVELLERCQTDPMLRQRLHCPGPSGNVADWYAVADLFVLSSRYEGFPNVLLEAMASGCACLACACPTGPDEIVTHDVDGWLVPAEVSAQELADALVKLMGDQQLRQRLGMTALTVRERYAEQAVQRRFLAAIAPWLSV
jgi:glycosyltransferase involved in cell wall biosynthesis